MANRIRPLVKETTRRFLTISGEHPLGSTASSRPTSGYTLRGLPPADADAEAPVPTDGFNRTEVATQGNNYPLEVRLNQALLAIRERDDRIYQLMQQVEALTSCRPMGSDPDAPSGSIASTRKPELQDCSPDEPTENQVEGSTSADTCDRGVRWHSISIGDSVHASSAPSERKETRRAIELEVVFEPETQFYTGLTQDISAGGVFIATYNTQPVGTLISLSFELPCGTAVSVFGEVRWLRDDSEDIRPGMGVAFIGLAESSKAAIERFCETKSSLYVEL